MRGLPAKARQALVLTPVLAASNRTYELPAVVFNGRKRDKVYRRSLALEKNRKRKHSRPVPGNRSPERATEYPTGRASPGCNGKAMYGE